MNQAAFDSALWAFGRGTGVVALALLTVSIVLGVVTRLRARCQGLGRFWASDLHRTAALSETDWSPSTSSACWWTHTPSVYRRRRPVPGKLYRPAWLGLGTLAVDLLGIITVVSLLRGRVQPRVFRSVRWATYLL